METDGPSTGDLQKTAPKTLGDVLFARKGGARPQERAWAGLVRSIAAGDQRALHALYAQTNRIVFTLIMRITGSRESAEEVTVDVFHDVWRRASAYDPAGASVLGCIMNQARSRAIDRVRYERRKKRADAPGRNGGPVAAPVVPPETGEAREAAGLLQRALLGLTPEERQAIETAFFSELTHRETAEKLCVPIGTVKTRIRSGLSKIRLALARNGDGR